MGLVEAIKETNRCVLLVDGGDSLFDRRRYAPNQLSAAHEKADFILKSYLDMGYQAINIGVADWAGGGGYLLSRIKTQRYPLISANLESSDPALTLPPPYMMVDLCGCRVGITGVISNQFASFEGHPDIIVKDPVPIVRDAVGRLRKECRFIVLLSNLGTAMDTHIAQEIEGINIIVGSRSGALYNPRKVNETYLCYPKGNGQWLGWLDVAVAPDGAINRIEHHVLVLDDKTPEK